MSTKRNSMGRIVDLSLPIENGSPLPPPVQRKVTIEILSFPGPAYVQGSWLSIYSHTATHVDAPRHVFQDGKPHPEVPLESVIGEAVVLDLSHLGDQARITAEVLAPHASEIRPGDIVIVRTDWTDKTWPTEDYFVQSPYMTEEGAQWLVARKPKAVGFDFFKEWAPRFVKFNPEEFVVHRAFLGNNIFIIDGLTGLGKLKKKRVQLFAAPVKFASNVDGSPARVFAVEDD